MIRDRFLPWLIQFAGQHESIPPPGRAWCLRCTLNKGRDLDLPAHLTAEHMREHRAAPESARNVRVIMSQKAD